ncbi:EAL domain-containing protein [Cohaesibacter celericrescens]|uniref:EAL domain-containing protein n=1 Tax=Cohaesibacter celericrescens TaxID=2067669 RepID=UPI00356A59B3
MRLYKYLFTMTKYPRTFVFGLFSSLFLVTLVIASSISIFQVFQSLETQLSEEIKAADQLDPSFDATMEALTHNIAAPACSSDYLFWLRKVAFLPDGIHEILYADEHQSCSVSRGKLPDGFELGKADLERLDMGYTFWFDRDLAAIGYPGLKGTFLQKGNLTLVLPPMNAQASWVPWQNQEFVSKNGLGDWVHRTGKLGLKKSYPNVKNQQVGYSVSRWAFWGFQCDPSNLVCLFIEAPVTALIAANKLFITVGLILMLATSLVLTEAARNKFLRMMSLSSRFAHTMCKDSLVCHYQPILRLETGEIEGVEVLVRWRDLDGSLVYPNAFLPVVEARNMSRLLTELIVNNTVKDLAGVQFGTERPKVNINVFPQDLDADWLIRILSPLQIAPCAFRPVVEIVETSDLPLESTREAIALMRANGIETYIDDFGVGYSSIHYLSGLGADGVKLDRFFAMAPEDTLSSKLLFSAIEMVSKTGQILVVEGVETQTKLMSLRATNKVDLVQGYYISPPLPAARLATFLKGFQQKREHTAGAYPKAVRDNIIGL